MCERGELEPVWRVVWRMLSVFVGWDKARRGLVHSVGQIAAVPVCMRYLEHLGQ